MTIYGKLTTGRYIWICLLRNQVALVEELFCLIVFFKTCFIFWYKFSLFYHVPLVLDYCLCLFGFNFSLPWMMSYYWFYLYVRAPCLFIFIFFKHLLKILLAGSDLLLILLIISNFRISLSILIIAIVSFGFTLPRIFISFIINHLNSKLDEIVTFLFLFLCLCLFLMGLFCYFETTSAVSSPFN